MIECSLTKEIEAIKRVLHRQEIVTIEIGKKIVQLEKQLREVIK